MLRKLLAALRLYLRFKRGKPVSYDQFKPFFGMALDFAISRGKEWAAADGVTDWKDYAIQILAGIREEVRPLVGAAGEPDRLAVAVADFQAMVEG